MKIRPYVLLSESTLNRLHVRLLEVTSEWRADWGVGGVTETISCVRAWDVSSPSAAVADWQIHYAANDKELWFGWRSSEVESAIQKHIFPSDRRLEMVGQPTEGIATVTAKKASLNLIDRIAGTFGLTQDAGQSTETVIPESQLYRHGSGAVLVQIRLGDRSISCLLNYASVMAVASIEATPQIKAMPLTDLMQALQDIPVSVPIELGRVEIDVATLMSLHTGDVVRLRSSVDKPLEIRNQDGATLFHAHLGKRDGSVAIEIADH